MFKKEKTIWPGIIQQPINALAGSRRIGMKTARPGGEVNIKRASALASLDYRSQ